MSRGDSILQTASIARCVSVPVTATNHTIFDSPVQHRRAATIFLLQSARRRSYPRRGKSSGPKIWRISSSPSQPGQCFLCRSMKRNAPSSASCFDFNSKIANPPMTSLASVKGPSIVVSCPRESRTRWLTAVGASPPFATIVPSLTASSAITAIASISSLGGAPEFSPCLTIIMNRIVISPFDFGLRAAPSGEFHPAVPLSIYTSNEAPRNRQVQSLFFRPHHPSHRAQISSRTLALLCLLLQLRKLGRGLLHVGRKFGHLVHLANLDHLVL